MIWLNDRLLLELRIGVPGSDVVFAVESVSIRRDWGALLNDNFESSLYQIIGMSSLSDSISFSAVILDNSGGGHSISIGVLLIFEVTWSLWFVDW